MFLKSVFFCGSTFCSVAAGAKVTLWIEKVANLCCKLLPGLNYSWSISVKRLYSLCLCGCFAVAFSPTVSKHTCKVVLLWKHDRLVFEDVSFSNYGNQTVLSKVQIVKYKLYQFSKCSFSTLFGTVCMTKHAVCLPF